MHGTVSGCPAFGTQPSFVPRLCLSFGPEPRKHPPKCRAGFGLMGWWEHSCRLRCPCSPAIRDDVNAPISERMQWHSRRWSASVPIGDDLLPSGFVQDPAVSGTLPPDVKLLEAKHILDRNA